MMMGDFDDQVWDFDDTLSSSHLAKLQLMITVLKQYFPIAYLGGHKEYLPGKGYSCPGNQLIAVMGKLRKNNGLQSP
jgi:hypothetical protein